ncbi:sugar ABC transporter permease [Marinitenerispora sediminis]|uniref:Xylose transport system permease protein XylH n=1 Tax=Marinitenerispora sediminis TaxID=1931232 RepID=A0A368T932_9ACTN|nr:sugar ABC transporter permease [Marinitenerispora sediminis]RCV52366.1 ABC transporter permease [Marinitenerispora sediminis]RCV60931.1 ABC transporter permease [Marinitenerispora sediminis]RCV62222.1 ABC transporter permease [Marinitenerispora sediminis]
MAQQTPVAGEAAPAPDPRLIVTGSSPRGLVAAALRRLRGGELGALPVIVGLIVICAVFQSLNSNFLSPQNLSNLTLQVVSTGLMSCGVIMVLLLGEIDLSVGSVSGVSGAVLAVLAVNHGIPEVAAIALAVLTGTLIGVVHGTVFAKVGVPAFVVTLAGLIGWQGAQLYLLGSDGTINVPYDGAIAYLTQTYFVPAVGWGIAVAAVGLYAGLTLLGERRRTAAGLPAKSAAEVIARTVLLAVPVFGGVAVLNLWNGVPLAFLIFLGFVVVFDLVLRKTRYGRMVFAVGGSAEAARRAGINVDLIRISVFALASTLAAVGGVLAVSRGFAVSQSSGSGDVLMLAIAAAVIGGTSLFGGRGSAYSALLGGLVLGAITSGLYLLQMDSSVRYMITAAVLLIAVILDAVSRRSRRAHARG